MAKSIWTSAPKASSAGWSSRFPAASPLADTARLKAGHPAFCCGATRMLRRFCAAAKEISPDVNKGIVG
jgi:hypothetical protein